MPGLVLLDGEHLCRAREAPLRLLEVLAFGVQHPETEHRLALDIAVGDGAADLQGFCEAELCVLIPAQIEDGEAQAGQGVDLADLVAERAGQVQCVLKRRPSTSVVDVG